MIKKLNEEDKIILVIILAITTLLGNAFLKTHFSSDTYVLIDLGYFEYPSQYFLLDGRLISTLACYIAGIYKIPYFTYLLGMDIIGICLLTLAIFVFYKNIVKLLRSKRKIA